MSLKDQIPSFLGGPVKLGKSNFESNYPTYPYGRARTKSNPTALEPPVSKSWLFEIVEKDSDWIQESFTLILPPQAVSIKEPQRISITKTFGNAFVDDYGPDNLQITLKGISGTSHLFPTFSNQSGISSLGYTGKDAFYEFQNKIIRYKNNIANWDTYELRVYDLADKQSYKCVLLDFSLDRSSENPMYYPFTISLFVYANADNYVVKKDLISISEYPEKSLSSIENLSKKLIESYQDIKAITDAASMLYARSLELKSKWNKALNTATNLFTSPLDLAKNLVQSAFVLVRAAKDTHDAGLYIMERYMGCSEYARVLLNDSLRVYGYQISEGWQKVGKIEYEKDAGIIPFSEATATTPAVPASRNSVPVSFSYSGLKQYTVKGADTLQSIALSQLGDITLWPNITYVNKRILGNSDLVSGSVIFIPVQEAAGGSPNNENKPGYIISEDTQRDPYGADLLLDADGNLILTAGNATLVAGVENIKQAINMRLNTETGSMITQSAYGIIAQAGFAGTSMAVKYMEMSIRRVIMQDPRVHAVESLTVEFDSDVIHVNVAISLIGRDETLPISLAL